MARVAALLLTAVALAFAAAGCGGGGDSGSSSSGESPEAWAADVCGALQTWTQDIQAKSQALGSDIRSSGDFKSAKGKLVAFLDDTKASTQKMIDDVKAAGPPDTDNGPSLQQELEAGLTQVRDTFDNAVTQAKALDTSNTSAFISGVSELSQQIQSEAAAIETHFKKIESSAGDLNKAIQDEPACKSFASGSSSG
jgi:hypothetical protein